MTDYSTVDDKLNAGGIIGKFIRLLRERFWGFAGVGILQMLVVLGLLLGAGIVIGGIAGVGALVLGTGLQPIDSLSQVSPGMLILGVIFFVISIATYALIIGVSVFMSMGLSLNLLKEGNFKPGAALNDGIACTWRGCMVLFALFFGMALLFAIVVGLPAWLISPASIAVTYPLCIIAVMVISVIITPWAAVLVNERLGLASLGRSAQLTAGYRWAIVWSMILFVLVILAAEIVVLLIAGVIAAIVYAISLASTAAAIAIGGLIGLAVGIFFFCLYLAIIGASGLYTTLIYERLLTLKGQTLSGIDTGVFD